MNVTVLRHGPFYSDPRVVKQALALCEAGDDVRVLCRGESPAWTSHPRLTVRETTRRAVSDNPLVLAVQSVGFALRAAVALARSRTDVVVVHSIPSWLVFAALTAKLRNRAARIVLDHHEPEAEMLAEAGVPGPVARLYGKIERAAVRRADGVVDVSPEMAERSRALGARAQVVVDNAPALFGEETSAGSDEWDLAVFGSLIVRYDLPVVGRALALSKEPFDVVQIGRGPAALEANASGGRLTSVAYCPPPELQARLRSARWGFVGLAPSDFTGYVSPNRLWELVSLRVPAIVAETPLTRRLLGDHALFYEGGDAASLADALRRSREVSAQQRAGMTEGAYERLRDRLWEQQAPAFVEFCRPVR